MDLKNVTQVGGIVLGHELVERALSMLLDGATKHGAEYIKANFLGVGTDDEALYRSAVNYAVFEKGKKPEQIIKISKVIKSYPKASRSRIIRIIGKSEEIITMEVPTGELDKNGKEKVKKVTQTFNVRGGQTLAIWADLSEDDIKADIESSQMTAPLGDAVYEALSPANLKAQAVKVGGNVKAGYDNIGNGLYNNYTVLDNFAFETSNFKKNILKKLKIIAVVLAIMALIIAAYAVVFI